MSYTNLASTTLVSDITSGTTSISVTDGSVFPTTGCNLLINNELLRCTSRSSNTLTCVRGVDESTASAHSAGDDVFLLLSGSFTNRNLITRNKNQTFFSSGGGGGGSTVSSGPLASLPTAGTAGNVYLPTDGIYQYVDNGGTYLKYGPLQLLTEPVNADFSWVNQGAATVSTARGGVYLHNEGHAGESMSMRIKTIPTAPFVVTMACQIHMIAMSDLHCGMCLRETSSGKIVTNSAYSTGFVQYKYSGSTSFAGQYNTKALPRGYSGLHWFRIEDDGTNRITSVSDNGVTFQVLHSVGNTDYITADQIGFYVNAKAASQPSDIGLWVLHWDEA